MGARRAVMTEAQARRFIRAARAEDPRAVVEIVTEAGTVRIMPGNTVDQNQPGHHPSATDDEPEPWT